MVLIVLRAYNYYINLYISTEVTKIVKKFSFVTFNYAV
jgi:hypothetical protein